MIWDNRIQLDGFDPITATNPSAQYNLSNWDFEHNNAWYCQEASNICNCSLRKDNSSAQFIGDNQYYYNGKWQTNGVMPIFEVPVM